MKHDEYRISPRRLLRVGDLFRVSQGPVSIDGGHRMGTRGLFEFRGALHTSKRWYVDAVQVVRGVDKQGKPTVMHGAQHMLFVGPGSYKRLGVLWRPYKLRKVRKG